MASLIPFRALRPAPDVAAEVAAVPYDVVTTEEARRLADGHPLSFLHVSRAEIDLPPGHRSIRRSGVPDGAPQFARLRQQAPLVMDDEPSVYLYRLRMGDHVQTGVAACFSVDEYRPRRDQEAREDAARQGRRPHAPHDRAQGADRAGLSHLRASPAVDDAVGREAQGHRSTTSRRRRRAAHVWRVAGAERAALVGAFARDSPALHRGRASPGGQRRARARRALEGGRRRDAQEWDAFLAVAFPTTRCRSCPYNRVVKDLGAVRPAKSSDSSSQATSRRAAARDAAPKGEVAMFLAGHGTRSSSTAHPNPRSPIDRLDVSALQEQRARTVLGIGDPRADKRIDFVGGARGTRRSSGPSAAAARPSRFRCTR